MDNTALNIANENRVKSGVKRLTLTDFRNYDFLRIYAELAPIVITGENGSGKTNILEAISYLAPGRGLRSSRLTDVKRLGSEDIVNGTAWAVNAVVSCDGEESEIGTAVEKSYREDDEVRSSFDRRIVKIDGLKIPSQAELGKYISMVWLTPQMDRLFRGGAQPRRSFLDRLVYAFDLEHAKRSSSFEQMYREWTHLLRIGSNDKNWLFSLEDNMASLGVAIAAARREQIAKLNKFIEKEPDDVFPNVVLELDGMIEKLLDEKPAVDVEDFYRNYLFSQRKSVAFNENGVDGVNKTDFKVLHRQKNMPAELCSTGEQKSLLISIILAQTKCQTLDKGFAPVLLLDEITAHLDDLKREALLEKIVGLNVQAWITSTDEGLFGSLKNEAQFIKVDNGCINK